MKKNRILALLTALLLVFTVQGLVESNTPALPTQADIMSMVLEGTEETMKMAAMFFETAPYELAFAARQEALKALPDLLKQPATEGAPAITEEQAAGLMQLLINSGNTLGRRAVETQQATFGMFTEEGAFIGNGIPAQAAPPQTMEEIAQFIEMEYARMAALQELYTKMYNDDIQHINIRASLLKGVLASAGFKYVEGITFNNIPVKLLTRSNGTALLCAETLLRVKQAQWLLMNNPGMTPDRLLVDHRTLLVDGQPAGDMLVNTPRMLHHHLFGDSFLVYHPEDGYYRLDVISVRAPLPEPPAPVVEAKPDVEKPSAPVAPVSPNYPPV